MISLLLHPCAALTPSLPEAFLVICIVPSVLKNGKRAKTLAGSLAFKPVSHLCIEQTGCTCYDLRKCTQAIGARRKHYQWGNSVVRNPPTHTHTAWEEATTWNGTGHQTCASNLEQRWQAGISIKNIQKTDGKSHVRCSWVGWCVIFRWPQWIGTEDEQLLHDTSMLA